MLTENRRRTWAQGANRLKILLLCTLCLLCISKTYAQEDDFKFQAQFISNLRYPESLISSCKATYTNMLIEISKDRKIQKIVISDSAPPEFRKAFEAIKGKLDTTTLLNGIIKKNRLRNCNILIPIFYIYAQGYCANEPVIDNNTYLSFDGKPTDRLSFTLRPIVIRINAPMQ